MKKIHRSTQSASGKSGRKPTKQSAPRKSGWKSAKKRLLVGVALTGAKFTPLNHLDTGNPILDAILRGDYLRTNSSELAQEVMSLYALGVRYFHLHARNPVTREQSCDEQLYRLFGTILRSWNPEVILSYGASRNGREIIDAIRTGGEWERMRQVLLTREEGGADFVTTQAAAELKIILDLERQGFIHCPTDYPRSFKILKSLDDYVPDGTAEELSIGANSTNGGANYGRSSALTQFEMYRRACAARGNIHLPQEIEFTQLSRSYALAKLALNELDLGLGNTGRLNITILFGFSPLLPFPMTYHAFREAVDLVRTLQYHDRFPALHLTVTVGAAVLPREVAQLIAPLDVGPQKGKIVTPLERLLAYACMEDSGVDGFRFGLEDAPYLVGEQGKVLPATNLEIARFIVEKLPLHGGEAITDPVWLRQFVSTETRSPLPAGVFPVKE